MIPLPPDLDPIENFQRRLEEMLAGKGLESGEFSAEDRQALDIARRLAGINPSAANRLRFPLRRSLLEGGWRVGLTNRMTRLLPVSRRLPAGARLLQRLAPSLSLVVILVFLVIGSVAGLYPPAISFQPARSTERRLEGAPSGQAGPLPADTGSLAAAGFSPAGPSPQPIPTPAAPHGEVTSVPNRLQASLTPVLDIGSDPPPGSPGASNAIKP